MRTLRKSHKSLSNKCKSVGLLTTVILSSALIPLCAVYASHSKPGTAQDHLPENKLGPKLLLVPEGEFVMGSPVSEKGRYEDEGPQFTVTISKPFFMAETPITVAQFRTFIEATGYKTIAEKEQWSENDRS